MRLKVTIITLGILKLATLWFPLTLLAQTSVPCKNEYTVQASDWLRKIAEKYFGDASAYKQILTATNSQTDKRFATIEDPDVIEPGWLLCIPVAGATSSESEASSKLVESIWLWNQTLMKDEPTFVPSNPNNYNIEFRPDGTVSIQADCNQASGSYRVEESSITIQTGPTTLAACPPGSLGEQFLAQLNGAASYFFQKNNLFIALKLDSSTMQLTAQSPKLAGTSWSVIGYNNGQGGVVSVITGTEMVATFGKDGRLNGSAGCNNYNTSYTVNGKNIRIGSVASTRKFCAEPKGIMEQEQQYLGALETATTYSLRGERLELRTATGALAASFALVPALVN